MTLGACIQPVDVTSFMDNPKVIEQVENNKESVKLDPLGDNAGLKTANKKITGLDPNKYYMVETETDDNGTLVTPTNYPKYVTENPLLTKGQLINDLGFITRVSGGSIIGLTNFYTYKVRVAEPFLTGSITYSENGGAGMPVSVNSGVVNIPAPSTGTTLTLDLSSLTAGASYEVMAVAVSPATTTTNWNTFSGGSYKSKTGTNWSALPLEGEGTTVDYVFVNNTANPKEFKVLRVVIAPQTSQSITLTLTFTFADQTNVSLDSGSATIAIGSLDGLSFAKLKLNVSASNINWYHDGTSIQTGGTTLELKNDNVINPYLVVGTHVFTVKAEIDTVPYSAEFKLTVTE
jgi:hypothetical protein